MLMRVCALFVLLLAGAFASPARAAVSVEVAGNTATADIALGGVEAELILTFDGATNLSAQSLGLSAQLVSLTDPLLLARLPSTSLTSLPAALPLLITVEPPSLGGLSLVNTVRAEVHTHALPYTAGSAFRLFKAPLNGAFRDITDEVAPGSVRTRGTTGGFSQFLVLVDLRPTSGVIAEKISWMRSRSAALPLVERTPIDAQITAAETAIAEARYADAIAAVDALRARVSARAGSFIPNQWTPTQRDANLAGDLLGGAASLKFSIGYLRDYGN
jgi:hypothetical protein